MLLPAFIDDHEEVARESDQCRSRTSARLAVPASQVATVGTCETTTPGASRSLPSTLPSRRPKLGDAVVSRLRGILIPPPGPCHESRLRIEGDAACPNDDAADVTRVAISSG